MNIRPKKQNIDGILLLDKPKGMSSNTALQTVKHLLNAKKAGHTGSLDPLASGLLPLCFGEATKFSQFLLDADKHYQVVAKLGEKTTTADAEGEIIQTLPVPVLTEAALEALLTGFRGDIEQVPSMFSAIKHQGQPLYKLARLGIEVERQARPVSIYRLQVLAMTSDTLTLDVLCSKGTYVRNLVEDIGDALGCGAHVIELRRLGVGPYLAEQMVTLTQLESTLAEQGMAGLNAYLLGMDSAVKNWPLVTLTETGAFYLRQGQSVLVPQTPPSQTWVRLVQADGRFLGVGEVLDDGKVAPKRLVAS